VAGSVARPVEGLKAKPVAEPIADPVTDLVAEPAPGPSPATSLDKFLQAQKVQLEQFLQGLADGNPVKSKIAAVMSERNKVTSVKRELNDRDTPTGPQKKPKKMIGKVTIDLTEDDEPPGLVIELD
jgi:hypothetical protein